MAKFDAKEWMPGIINALALVGILALITSINFIVDPFALNRQFDLSMEKRAVSFKLNYYNWKFAQFKNAPAPLVLFGDSRMNTLPEEIFAEEFERPAYNFAFGGANGSDVIDAFWFASEHQELERVYIGLNALLLNDRNRVRRARQALDVLEDPLRYYISPLVTQATFRVLLYNLFDINLVSEKPPMSEDEFWRYELKTAPGQMFSDYAYPDRLLAEMAEVADYCASNGIDLTIMILPTHVDLQARRDDFGIENQYRRSLDALRGMVRVLDWDYPNDLTRDRKRFLDPFHLAPEAALEIAREAASGKGGLAR